MLEDREISMTYELDRPIARRVAAACAKSGVSWRGWLGVRVALYSMGALSVMGVMGAALFILNAFDAEIPKPLVVYGSVVIVPAIWFWLARALNAESVDRALASAIAQETSTMTLSSTGMRVSSASAKFAFDWRAIDDFIAVRDGFGFRVGAMVFPVPSYSLPSGVTPDDIRAMAVRWGMGTN
ncbi:MAG: hypothetical protein AAF409_02890 [Pseudomonadota bacterium]